MIHLDETVVYHLHLPLPDAVAEAEVVPVQDIDGVGEWWPLPVSVTELPHLVLRVHEGGQPVQVDVGQGVPVIELDIKPGLYRIT